MTRRGRWVEAESSKVGDCRVPPQLWKAMVAAPRWRLRRPAGAGGLSDPGLCRRGGRCRPAVWAIDRLRQSQSHDQVDDWQRLARDGAFTELADSLMERHYDPRYEKHRERMALPLVELAAQRLGADDLAALAAAVAAAVRQHAG